MTETVNHIAKLPNSPLQEVIFELRWHLDYESNGIKFDSGFELAQGIFARLIEEKGFKIRKRLLADAIQLPGVPVHQFWKDDNTWPVIQLGQGILTVNDTEKNYHWVDTFYPLIKEALTILLEAYKEPPSFTKIVLKYIDAVEINEPVLNFVNSNFKINISTNFEHDGELNDISYGCGFKLKDDSIHNLVINSAISSRGSKALIWQSIVQLENSFNADQVLTWLDDKHTLLSKQFKQTITREFYEKFK